MGMRSRIVLDACNPVLGRDSSIADEVEHNGIAAPPRNTCPARNVEDAGLPAAALVLIVDSTIGAEAEHAVKWSDLQVFFEIGGLVLSYCNASGNLSEPVFRLIVADYKHCPAASVWSC